MTNPGETTLKASDTAFAGKATPPPLPPPMAGNQTRKWDLGGGATAHIVLPEHLTRRNVDRLRKFIEALANEAAIVWDDEDEESGS